MKVLSLFNGMGCIWLALDKLGIPVEVRYSSEIDRHAIQVNDHNYADTIQLGDVTKVKGSDLEIIDLLVGGSPCQGFSFAGKQLNFEDPRSKLFFEFVRLLKETRPKYFLLENVKMKKEHEQIITEHLGVEPIMINSALLTAQRRERLYWTNIPNIMQPVDKGIFLRDIVDYDEPNRHIVDRSRIIQQWESKNYLQYDLTGKGHKSQDQRAYYLDSKHGTLPANGGITKVKTILPNGDIVRLTPKECERLQSVPDDYTSCVSESQRYKMLGNGWTVDVIAHILRYMDLN